MMLAADGLPMTNFLLPLKVKDWWSSLKATVSLETLESMYAMYEEFPKKSSGFQNMMQSIFLGDLRGDLNTHAEKFVRKICVKKFKL